ncbi:hypothetical protein B566_EDAN003892 [Ephemera danica]|nr:hypothetical protein B566_EDAN003892 [Ephemera danica]
MITGVHMPQTVPCSAGFSPLPDYLSSFAADSFDLSLLPDDGAVPSSPTQLMALCEANALSPPAFHDPLFDFKCYVKEEPLGALSPCSSSSSSAVTYDYAASSASSSCSSPSGARRCPSPDLHDLFQETQSDSSEFRGLLEQATPAVRQDANLRSLLQEPPVRSTAELEGLLRESHRAIQQNNSNLRSLLQEPPARATPDLRTLLQDSARQASELQNLLQESLSVQDLLRPASIKRPANDFDTPRPAKRPANDHQLLREVNELDAGLAQVKSEPVAADVAAVQAPQPLQQQQQQQQLTNTASTSGALGGELSCDAERIEPVLSLALQQLRRDVDNTCSVLGISPEPSQWTVDDVKAWLLWTLSQFSLPMIAMEYFNMDGAALAALTENDFEQRAPQCGSTLYAQLEVWKATSADRSGPGPHLLQSWASPMNVASCETNGSTPTLQEPSEDDEEDEEAEMSDVASPSSSAASVAGTSTTASHTTSTPTRGGGSHIHLWQFLKELLSQPQVHGSCIRWLDRTKGIFKIEDSVRVARLWGRRKNRPAMNYDKLSRSIRQYYKKGIMKKTERSQRLVYQFCHPYCL